MGHKAQLHEQAERLRKASVCQELVFWELALASKPDYSHICKESGVYKGRS